MSFKIGSAPSGRSSDKQAPWTSEDLKISPHAKKVISKSPAIQKLKSTPKTGDGDNKRTGSYSGKPDILDISEEEDEDREIQEFMARGMDDLPNPDPSRSSVDLEREMDRQEGSGFPADDESVYESAPESFEVSVVPKVPKGMSDDRDSSIYESPTAEMDLPEISSPKREITLPEIHSPRREITSARREIIPPVSTRGKSPKESELWQEMEQVRIDVDPVDIAKSKQSGKNSHSACFASPILNRLGQNVTPRLEAKSVVKSPAKSPLNRRRVSMSVNPDQSQVSRGLSNLRKLFRSSSLPSLDKNESCNAGDGKVHGGPGEGESGSCMGGSTLTNKHSKMKQGEGPTLLLYI